MSLEDDIAFFEKLPSFAALGKPALHVLAIGAETKRLSNGAVLFYAGELTDGGYVDRKSTRLNSSHLGISYAVGKRHPRPIFGVRNVFRLR